VCYVPSDDKDEKTRELSTVYGKCSVRGTKEA